MELDNVLNSIKKSFMLRKIVDVADTGIRVELEPLTAAEEMKIMAYCKDFQGAEYIDALKRSSLACSIKKLSDQDLSMPDIVYIEDNKPITKSKFLYMLDYISKWPTPFLDILFAAYFDLTQEVEAKVNGAVKFERFQVTEKPVEQDTKKTFRQVKETEGDLSADQKLKQQVDREVEIENEKMAQAESDALARIKK